MSAPFVERTPLSDATPSSQASTHSPPNSPRSIASLPSPPSSPRHRERDVNSIPGSPSSMASDFPLSSLNSSLFLSEVSSPVLHPSLNEDASSKTLIIPSLTLPDTRHNSTAGEAIGNLRLWVMGRRSLGCKSAAESLVIGAPLISEVNEWSTSSDGYSVLRASTMLSLDRDPLHSADRERRCNVEIFVVEYEEHQDAPIILDSILSVIHRPFLSIDRLLNDSEPSTTSFIPLLTSSTTHLYTGLVFLLSSSSSQTEHVLMTELSAHLPVIPIPVPSSHAPSHTHSRHPSATNTVSISSVPAALSSLRPGSLLQLRDSVFHHSTTLEHLRTEAAERFLRWRDLNAALRHFSSPSSSILASGAHTVRRRPRADTTRSVPGGVLEVSGIPPSDTITRDVANEWMWNWETRFSRDVHESQIKAAGLDKYEVKEGDDSKAPHSEHDQSSEPVGGPDFGQSHGDPLHLRSVARLAFSLVPVLATKYLFRRETSAPQTMTPLIRTRGRWGISWAMFGLGVGVGITVSLCVVGFRLGL